MTGKPILLDLFCGAGGAADGYAQAGFDVFGVDINPQPNYLYHFLQGDAIAVLQTLVNGESVTFGEISLSLKQITFIHASPPCQAYTRVKALVRAKGLPTNYPDLVEPVRNLLAKTGKPYVIENVPGAPVRKDIVLNGLFFNLRVIRERWFECGGWKPLFVPRLPKKPKGWTTNSYKGYSSFKKAQLISVAGNNFSVADAHTAMGVTRKMKRAEIAEAIPPCYTRWIAEQFFMTEDERK